MKREVKEGTEGELCKGEGRRGTLKETGMSIQGGCMSYLRETKGNRNVHTRRVLEKEGRE